MNQVPATRSRRLPHHARRLLGLAAVAGLAMACSESEQPLAVAALDHSHGATAVSRPQSAIVNPPKIFTEALSMPRRFRDDVAAQVRLKPDGRPTNVVNIKDASNLAVMRFTVQPNVRFPWHTHPGLVMVNVVQGEMVFVYADDCVERRYDDTQAFVDPGFGTVHYAYNPTGGETVLVATFLGVPPGAPLTSALPQAEGDALDIKCDVPTDLIR